MRSCTEIPYKLHSLLCISRLVPSDNQGSIDGLTPHWNWSSSSRLPFFLCWPMHDRDNSKCSLCVTVVHKSLIFLTIKRHLNFDPEMSFYFKTWNMMMKCDSNLELNFKFTSLWVWEDFVGGLHYQGVSL